MKLLRYPGQSISVGERVRVMFAYDRDTEVLGTVVRDDSGPPWVTIIRLDDDRYVLTTEVQYRFEKGAPE